jgi:hypothetical protein
VNEKSNLSSWSGGVWLDDCVFFVDNNNWWIIKQQTNFLHCSYLWAVRSRYDEITRWSSRDGANCAAATTIVRRNNDEQKTRREKKKENCRKSLPCNSDTFSFLLFSVWKAASMASIRKQRKPLFVVEKGKTNEWDEKEKRKKKKKQSKKEIAREKTYNITLSICYIFQHMCSATHWWTFDIVGRTTKEEQTEQQTQMQSIPTQSKERK